ncbi:MAG TPA: hypothetical protein VF230_06870 [Acidimicrobiales bacterium]
MARQLVLLESTGADWRLDDRTREIGRRGVEHAREILRRAQEAARDADGGARPSQPAA